MSTASSPPPPPDFLPPFEAPLPSIEPIFLSPTSLPPDFPPDFFGSPSPQQSPPADSFGSPSPQQSPPADSFGSPSPQQSPPADSFGSPPPHPSPSKPTQPVLGTPFPASPSGRESLGTSSPGGLSVGVGVEIAIGGVVTVVVVLVVLTLICFFYKKKRVKDNETRSSPKDGASYVGQKQQNVMPPSDHMVISLPPPKLLSPLPRQPPFTSSSSGGSSSKYSDHSFLPPPSPGLVLSNIYKGTFSYEELAIATDGFSEENLLGQGGFGYVFKGILPNGKDIAVKQLKAGSSQGEREFQAEVEIISRVHHNHLVALVGYCIADAQRLLVYEFVPNDTLEFHLHGKGRPPLEWSSRLKIAIGSAKGLSYLHENCNPKIIHRDIKAANILIDFKFEAKVADFGLAKIASDTNTHVSTRVMGTFGYLAPEYAASGKLTEKSDVYSFGVVLLELITGRRPVDANYVYADESLVDWARPLLIKAVEENNFEGLDDIKLNNEYNRDEMARMVACAAACVRYTARLRPHMDQVVRVLEGNISPSDMNGGITPGESNVYSTNYVTSQ